MLINTHETTTNDDFYNPDILDCIASLSSDEVATPPSRANEVLDMLPAEVWSNPDLKWLDPGCKTGVFLREAAKRLYVGLDKVIVDDAHEYLAKNWRNFDFIWSSPPCQSHSKVRMMASKGGSYDSVMPNMKLWAEIIFLQNFTKNTNIKFVVENVKPYYEPFVKPSLKLGRHLFWTNFDIPIIDIKDGLTHNERGSSEKGYFDLRDFKMKHRKDQIIRNCVDPNVGKYIFDIVNKINYEREKIS
jgi:DNA (cytosine-5)-methyltransferase 1